MGPAKGIFNWEDISFRHKFKLLYSLIAPPKLLSEIEEYEARETPSVPEKVHKMPLTFVLRINHLKWEVKNFERLFGSISIYDMKEKRKVTENFNFEFGADHKIFPVFNLEENKDEYVILLKIEKCFQSDQHDPIEAYQNDIPDAKREKIRLAAKNNESLLSQYRMQFAWTFVAFAGLRRRKFAPSENRRRSNESETYSVFDADRTSNSSFSIEDEAGAEFIPPNGAIDFSIKQVYKTDNEKLSDEQICWHIVDVCKNPQKYKQRTVNCEFSISLMSPVDLHNIRNDDGQKLKPWRNDVPHTIGKQVREFPVEGRIPRPLVSYRNVLYIFPISANFSNHQRARNIAVQIEIRNEFETIPAIFGEDGAMRSHHVSSVAYHRSHPTFLDEIKVEVPSNLTPDHHLFFTFFHISVKEGRQLPVGFSWLPLMNANQHLMNQQAHLPICSHPPPSGYGRISPDSNLPGVKWLENRKSLFRVNVLIDSNIHIEDRNVHYFLKCVLAAETLETEDTFTTVAGRRMPIEQLHEDLLCSIRSLAQNSAMSSIIKHLHTIFNRIVWLIVNPPLSERIVIAQAAFNTLVSLVSRIHEDPSLKKDVHGRNRYLEQYVYFVLREGIMDESSYEQNVPTLGRKDWIRHTMKSRNIAKPSCASISRHSSYSETLGLSRINPSASNPDLTPKKKATTMKNSPSMVNPPKEDIKRPLFEELAFQMVVCSNSSKEKVLENVWFFLEFITKSVTEQKVLLATEKAKSNPISERFFDYLKSIVSWITQEIVKRSVSRFSDARKMNSSFGFFIRDLVEILSKEQLFELIKQYHEITKEISKGDDQQAQSINILRARFFRLIVFHGSFFDLLEQRKSPSKILGDDPLSHVMADALKIMNSKNNLDVTSLDYNLCSLMKIQSAIDADNRYDDKSEEIACLFLPFVTSTLHRIHLFTDDSKEKHPNKMPVTSAQILLVVNLWVLRKICSSNRAFPEFVNSLDKKDLILFNQMLLSTTWLLKYSPEAVLDRKRNPSNSKKNIDQLELMNRGAGSAVNLLKQKSASLGRSPEIADTSLRSWKQIKTRGLNATSGSGRSSVSVIFDVDKGHQGIILDLDSSTEIFHSVLDILEKIYELKEKDEGDYWHRSYCQVMINILTCEGTAICSLTRLMKILRNQLPKFLPCLIYTPLLSAMCMKIANLLCSGNLEVSKSAQLTMMKILSDHYQRFSSISLPAYWINVGICDLLGLRRYQSFSELRTVNCGNLYFHLRELSSFGYSQNDSAEFRQHYIEFTERLLNLVEAVDTFIDLNSKNISSNLTLMQIADLLAFCPLARISALTALAEEQKETHPVEAGICHLHKAAILLEIIRYSPSPDSANLPKSAALFSREVGLRSLESEAFVSDWINRSLDSAVTEPTKLRLSVGHVTAVMFVQERDTRVSLGGFKQALEAAAKSFSKGKISEMSVRCYQTVLNLLAGDIASMRNITERMLQGNIIFNNFLPEYFSGQQEAIEQDDRFGDERFGCYFRVHYRGPAFSPNLANREFIIREPMASKLSEVSDRVRKSASALVGEDVELVMESVSPSDNTNSVQVTFLKVHRREWQTPFENWQDFVNLTNFVYATPFTASGDAHGDVKVIWILLSQKTFF